jgi:hypothetical protein
MSKNKIGLFILLLAIVCALLVRSQLLYFNLPLCANVDERQGLRLLIGFEENNLNPHFFRYPALYYYITYFFVKIFSSPENYIYWGRILNLVIGGSIALATYLLSSIIFNNKRVGLLAGLFTLSSPILVENSSYIITDPTLALFSILALYFMYKYFWIDNSPRYYILMTIFIGLGIATKYTALLLLFVYISIEIIKKSSYSTKNNQSTNIINKNIKPIYFTIIINLIGITLVIIPQILPKDIFVKLLLAGANINSVINIADINFIYGFLKKIIYVGVFCIFIGVISWFKPNIFQSLYRARIYLVILSTILIFFLLNPFVLVSIKQFIYDFGAELKANQFAGDSMQFINYLKIYYIKESLLVSILFILGLYWSIINKKNVLILIIYIIIFYLVIGSATRGFERYLTPILPIIFSIAAYGLYSLYRFISKFTRYGFLIALLSIFLIFTDNYLWLKPILGKIDHHDDIYDSYQFIIDNNFNKVYYSGTAPDIELELAGINTIQLAEKQINEQNISKILDNNSILLLDNSKNKFLKINNNEIILIKSIRAEYGQHIYKLIE